MNQAKENYKKFGAIEERLIEYVRSLRKMSFSGLDE